MNPSAPAAALLRVLTRQPASLNFYCASLTTAFTAAGPVSGVFTR